MVLRVISHKREGQRSRLFECEVRSWSRVTTNGGLKAGCHPCWVPGDLGLSTPDLCSVVSCY